MPAGATALRRDTRLYSSTVQFHDRLGRRPSTAFSVQGVSMLARRTAVATLLVAGALSTSFAFAQTPAGKAPNGEEVYKRVCAACHNAVQAPAAKMGPLGPPAGGLQARALPPE